MFRKILEKRATVEGDRTKGELIVSACSGERCEKRHHLFKGDINEEVHNCSFIFAIT